jgi:uncharacterized iron-regulated membrane protein
MATAIGGVEDVRNELEALLHELYYNVDKYPEALTSVDNLLKLVNQRQPVPVEVVRHFLSRQQPTYTRHRPAVKVAVEETKCYLAV